MEKFKLAIITAIFGTIGVISTFIPLSSSVIVFYRGIIASIVLFLFTIVSKNKLNYKLIKDNIFLIVLIGIMMSINWILQFESFRVASVSIGTVCYNTMPIFVIILAPIMFKERLMPKHIICVIIAMIGVVFVSNLVENGLSAKETLGCFYAIIAAICYALVVMLNKKLSHISSFEKIIPQFFVAALIVIPYILFYEKNTFCFYESTSEKEKIIGFILLMVLCIFHTGIVYVAYFDVVTKVNATTVAILTYVDPLVALCLSFLVLKENLSILQIVGALLILFATLINEFVTKPIKT